jgi:hypothetical protein
MTNYAYAVLESQIRYSFLYNVETDHYVVSLLAFDDQNMTATSVIIGSEEGPIATIPIVPDSALNGPAYGEWFQEEYAHVLSMYTGATLEKLFRHPDMVATSLCDDAGNFIDIQAV